ncbi:MAG: hypothetical protein JXD21_02500 [Candidatus Omnitrophica bacterium]|nr:hypothetical protein [Candidatus Omnitrophota bacterium]
MNRKIAIIIMILLIVWCIQDHPVSARTYNLERLKQRIEKRLDVIEDTLPKGDMAVLKGNDRDRSHTIENITRLMKQGEELEAKIAELEEQIARRLHALAEMIDAAQSSVSQDSGPSH